MIRTKRWKVINSVWETIRENINISANEGLGYSELKKHKPWFDQGYTKLLDQRKQAKLQWLQDPSEIDGDNLNIVRGEASRHFRDKKREYQNCFGGGFASCCFSLLRLYYSGRQ
jgi:hypothetical protein